MIVASKKPSLCIGIMFSLLRLEEAERGWYILTQQNRCCHFGDKDTFVNLERYF